MSFSGLASNGSFSSRPIAALLSIQLLLWFIITILNFPTTQTYTITPHARSGYKHFDSNEVYSKQYRVAKSNYHHRLCRRNGNAARKWSALLGTTAKLTDDIIDPAVYEEDLYGVLGCSRNATKNELKEAYWKIAMVSHPDRNSTPDAMYLFRNASRAYSILGRDEKMRAEYDSKYNTMKYLSVLEEYGSEVVIPLAMDVAVPLINITVQSIGSFAKPFFRDALEQSTAAYNAAFGDSEGGAGGTFTNDDDNVSADDIQAVLETLDIFTRTSLAIEKTSYDQRLRNVRESLLTTNERLVSTMTQIVEAQVLGIEIENKLSSLEVIENDAINRAVVTGGIALNAKTEYSNASTIEKDIEGMLTTQLETIESSKIEKERNDIKLKMAMEEVKQLEEQLVAAKGRVNQFKVNDIYLTDNINSIASNCDVSKAKLFLATMQRTDVEALYRISQQKKDFATEEANLATSKTTAVRNTYARHIDYKNVLDRKVNQLRIKKSTLDSVLDKTLQEKKEFDKKIQKIKQEKFPDSNKSNNKNYF